MSATRLQRLARGFNLTSWLDRAEPVRSDIGTLTELRLRGFTHVRLPIRAENLMPAYAPASAIDAHLRELDHALSTLTALDFAISIDVHPGDTFGAFHRNRPEEGYVLLEALWRMLAKRYRHLDADLVYFELLNEPTPAPAIWYAQAKRLIEAVRQVASEHTVVVGVGNYQRIDTLASAEPFGARNIVYAVHYYDPLAFTHQGLDWAGDDPLSHLRNVPFPGSLSDPAIKQQIATLDAQRHKQAADALREAFRMPWNRERIAKAFAQGGRWALRHRRPVIVNEFGVLKSYAPHRDRAYWIKAVRSAAESQCMGWAHWDYADGFGFVRSGGGRDKIDETIVDALLGPQR